MERLRSPGSGGQIWLNTAGSGGQIWLNTAAAAVFSFRSAPSHWDTRGRRLTCRSSGCASQHIPRSARAMLPTSGQRHVWAPEQMHAWTGSPRPDPTLQTSRDRAPSLFGREQHMYRSDVLTKEDTARAKSQNLGIDSILHHTPSPAITSLKLFVHRKKLLAQDSSLIRAMFWPHQGLVASCP